MGRVRAQRDGIMWSDLGPPYVHFNMTSLAPRAKDAQRKTEVKTELDGLGWTRREER